MHDENRRNFLRRAGIALIALSRFPRLTGARERDASTMELAPNGSDAAASPQPIRGLMIDAARQPESLDYYHRVVAFCAYWGLNTIQFRLTDDQGSALRFDSVPDLVTHPDALTPDQVKRLVEFATSHGIDLIPEVESFGHTGYITGSPKYRHMLDADTHGSSEFTGVIPVLSETRELFEKLYREVAAIFPSPYIHAGCDEVNWGGSELSRKALETRTRAQIWAEYLNSLQQIAEKLGKQLIVWGDFVLHKEPQILSELNKNMIVMDWNYWDTSAISFHDALVEIKESGHRAIGAPALISYRWGPRPGSEQLRNIDAFAEAYSAAGDASSLGVVLTNWVPTRYIQNSLWDGFAYAAVAFKEGPPVARVSAFRLFVERHYGAEWNELWAEAFALIYDAAPGMAARMEISPMGLHLRVPWSSDAQLAEVLKQRSHPANPFPRLRSSLVQLEPSVLTNLADFRAFTLSVACLDLLFWREETVMTHASQSPLDSKATGSLIQTIAERDRELVDKLSTDWAQGRSPESPAIGKLAASLEPKDQLLYQWREAAAYSSFLALHPDRFHQLLQAGASSKNGQPRE